MLDLLAVVEAASHLSFCMFGSYPRRFSRRSTEYKVLQLLDTGCHLCLYARDDDYLHLALFLTHILKNRYTFIRRSNFINTVDLLAYVNTFVEMKWSNDVFAGLLLYAFLKSNGVIW